MGLAHSSDNLGPARELGYLSAFLRHRVHCNHV